MKKNELITAISESTKMDAKEVSKVVESLMEEIKKSLLKNETVHLRGFGNFSLVKRAPKLARDISKDAEMQLPARYVPKCKFAIDFRQLVINKVKV